VDRKNFEYNDKIYFEMGVFEEKNGNLQDAIGNYKTSVRVSQGNNRQKGLSYLSLAKIYYDSLKNFELAKSYYDSTVNTLPKDEDNYIAIKERQEILVDFVKHITTIRLNDSLLSLSKLPPDSLKSWANSLVLQDSLQQLEKKKEAQKLARAQQQRESRVSDDEGVLITTSSDGTWYFDNPKSVSSGFTNFQRKWKQRPLEDHWRRSVKIISNQEVTSDENKEITPVKTVQEKTLTPTESTESNASKVASILAQIPTTPEEKEKLELEIRDALYALGGIYNFRLLETENAISTFEDLLQRFPGSPQEPEVLYQLFLLYQGEQDKNAQRVATKLSNEYPESIYAKLIANPNYREETFAITQQLQSVYRLAYNLYDKKQFEESQQLLDSALSLHPTNEFSDNLQILRILNIGQLEGQHQYQFELDNFVKTYSESELRPYAETLMETSNDYKANLYSSSKAKYSNDLNQPHYLVLAYVNSDENGAIAKRLIEAFKSKNNLTEPYANLLLSEEYSIIVMKNFSNKILAQNRSNSLASQYNLFDQFKGQKHSLFVMTEENFDIFYKTKDIETYKSFYDKYYR
ncbi:MAG: tetratricopeptide repeat protein, partial [Cyclobacteriaceae bacterium]